MNPKTILCIDDDSQVRELMSKFLQGKGYRVITATDGWDGLREIVVHRPDLILMDVNMPKLDGLNTLDMMKATRTERYIPIILVSGEGDRDTIMKAGELGADDFVVKPFSFEDLWKRIVAQLFTVDFPTLGALLGLLEGMKPSTVPNLDVAKYANWSAYPITYQNLELCVLLPKALSVADAKTLKESELAHQVVVLKRTRIHWRTIWPSHTSPSKKAA